MYGLQLGYCSKGGVCIGVGFVLMLVVLYDVYLYLVVDVGDGGIGVFVECLYYLVLLVGYVLFDGYGFGWMCIGGVGYCVGCE